MAGGFGFVEGLEPNFFFASSLARATTSFSLSERVTPVSHHLYEHLQSLTFGPVFKPLLDFAFPLSLSSSDRIIPVVGLGDMTGSLTRGLEDSCP